MLASKLVYGAVCRNPIAGFKSLKACICYQEYATVFARPSLNVRVIVSARPFSVSACALGRAADAKQSKKSSRDYTDNQILYVKKRFKHKHNNKKVKSGLQKGIDDHSNADKLNNDIKETVEMLRAKLRLDDTAIVSLNMNIDYLISLGLPFDVISKIALKAPKVFKMDLVVIKRRIRVLKINSIYEDSMIKMFKKNPALLLTNLEDTLSQKVESMRGLNLSLSVFEIAQILERCPDIIEYLSPAKLVEKVTFLKEKIGLTTKQLRKMLIKNPAVLTMKMETFKDKTDFCLSHLHVTLDQLSKYPRIFQCPVDRLKERYFFLKQENLTGEDVKIKGWALKALAANSDPYFTSKIAQKPLKQFRDFQEKMRIEKERLISEKVDEEKC